MRNKQLAATFLRVGKIINIVLLILFPVLLLIFAIIAIVAIVGAAAAADPDAALAAAVSSLLSAIFGYGFALVCVIVSFILNARASRVLANAKSKAEAKPGAIMAIVSGALMTLFPIASGILMLTTREEDWGEGEAEPAAEEPKEE